VFDILKKLLDRYFFNDETIYFAFFIFISFALLFFFGGILLPILISLVIAFLLNGLVLKLESYNFPRWVSLTIALLVFFIAYVSLFLVLPSIGSQINSLIINLPNLVDSLQQALTRLSVSYPEYLSEKEMEIIFSNLASQIDKLLSQALEQIAGTISFAFNALIYAILIPLMVFFFVKDKETLLPLISFFAPRERGLMDSIFNEMNDQIYNYVTGKFIEIIIVTFVSYIAFSFVGLPYTFLMSLLVGLSVIIPFFGAILVTIPVLLLGLYEWGFSENFYWLLGLYLVIQALDGNLLVPLLFSARNKLHPVVIVMSVLFFGGIWGFWGLFFAIPLATFVKAIINSWPQKSLN
jgi:putative permease